MDPRIRSLYRNLLFMGKEYPVSSGGYPKFRRQLKQAFQKSIVESEEDLQNALSRGDYITKELEALYFLTRYREMKRRYGEDS
ncbi:uncharacterized protein RJT20DRAFT_123707 [Scheffersomyces xylosifermentans]|uniref:uncharacterized protein n=1 Tax=Scheffersomyces xylosifermentans TaxID=1304137 RepID=UPI00315CE423